MKIETPSGSGNFIEIYRRNGDLVVSIQAKDCTGFINRAAVEIYGRGKGEIEPQVVQKLAAALDDFV